MVEARKRYDPDYGQPWKAVQPVKNGTWEIVKFGRPHSCPWHWHAWRSRVHRHNDKRQIGRIYDERR